MIVGLNNGSKPKLSVNGKTSETSSVGSGNCFFEGTNFLIFF